MERYSYAAFRNLFIDQEHNQILIKTFWQNENEGYPIDIKSIDLIIYVPPNFWVRGFLMIKFFKTKGEIAKLKSTLKKPIVVQPQIAKQKQTLSIQRKINFGFGENVEKLLNDINKLDQFNHIKLDQFDNMKQMRAAYYKKNKK